MTTGPRVDGGTGHQSMCASNFQEDDGRKKGETEKKGVKVGPING